MDPLKIILIIVSVLIIVAVLLQQRSSGLGGAFGGDDQVFTSRRGAEKTLYKLTILLGTIFVGIGLYLVYVDRPAKIAPTDTTTSSASPATSPTDNPTTPTN